MSREMDKEGEQYIYTGEVILIRLSFADKENKLIELADNKTKSVRQYSIKYGSNK